MYKFWLVENQSQSSYKQFSNLLFLLVFHFLWLYMFTRKEASPIPHVQISIFQSHTVWITLPYPSYTHSFIRSYINQNNTTTPLSKPRKSTPRKRHWLFPLLPNFKFNTYNRSRKTSLRSFIIDRWKWRSSGSTWSHRLRYFNASNATSPAVTIYSRDLSPRRKVIVQLSSTNVASTFFTIHGSIKYTLLFLLLHSISYNFIVFGFMLLWIFKLKLKTS